MKDPIISEAPPIKISVIGILLVIVFFILWATPQIEFQSQINNLNRFSPQKLWPKPTSLPPTFTPDQKELYEKCPELLEHPNDICLETMLNEATTLFNAIWPIFGILSGIALVIGLLILLTKEIKGGIV